MLPSQADVAEVAVLIEREVPDVHAPPDSGCEWIAASGCHPHRPLCQVPLVHGESEELVQ